MSRILPRALAFILLASCRDQPLTGSRIDFAFQPTSVDLGTVYVDSDVTRTVNLQNRSNAELSVEWERTGFPLDVVLPANVPSGSNSIQVHLHVTAAGPLVASLVARSG